MSLREIPESEAGHNDYARWYFEQQRREWEAEQRGGTDMTTPVTREEVTAA